MLRNLSIVLLITQSHHNSPLFQIPELSSFNHLTLSKSTFTKYFSPLFFSISTKALFNFDDCHFSHFLNSALVLNSIEHKNLLINNKISVPLNISQEKASFKRCVFESIISSSLIKSEHPIRITNSIFLNIKGSDGSCINTNSSIYLKHVTFDTVSASNEGGVFLLSSLLESSIEIEQTLFKNIESKYCGLFLRNSWGKTAIQDINSTNVNAIRRIGLFEVRKGRYTAVSHSIFENCGAKDLHGGIMQNDPQYFSIEKCVFVRMTLMSTSESLTASVLYIMNGYNSRVVGSIFLNYLNINSYVLRADRCVTAFISDCQFSGKKGAAVSFGFSLENCDYEVKNEKPIEEIIKAKVGYKKKSDIGMSILPAIEKNEEDEEDEKNDKNDKKFDLKGVDKKLLYSNLALRFVISCTVSLIISLSLNHCLSLRRTNYLPQALTRKNNRESM